MIALGKEHGYDFTWDEWVAASVEFAGDSQGELKLSRNELDAVAGGARGGGDGSDSGGVNTAHCMIYTSACITQDFFECGGSVGDPGGDIPPGGNIEIP